MDLTYQQILAEQYEENATNVLVQQQHDYDGEEVDYSGDAHENNALEDTDAFNAFQPRNKEENVIQPDAKKGNYKGSLQIRNNIINIDSRFRGNIVPTSATLCTTAPAENTLLVGTSSSYFSYYTQRAYKNVKTIRITSVEFPNTFYTFSDSRNNTNFTISNQSNSYNFVVRNGNYSVTQIVTEIQSQITALSLPYTITYDSIQHKIRFASTDNSVFTLTFPTTKNANMNGIGYNLGFLLQTYSLVSGVTADNVPDMIEDTYVYLAVNDYDSVQHPVYGQTSFTAFAKIILPSTKNVVIYDNNFTNSTSKVYHFQQPTNISKLEIKFLDAYGNVIDMNGGNVAITFEIDEIMDSAIYQHMIAM